MNYDLRDFLETKYIQYDSPSFIEKDPISIPHLFTNKEDIEIAGFLAATIAWGQRVTAVRNAEKIVKLMDYKPYDFTMNCSPNDLKVYNKFVHRTFNGEDCIYFIKSLKNIYKNHGGLENVFCQNDINVFNLKSSIINFHNIFFTHPVKPRTIRHISNPEKNSAAKRINMFLRWMVRKDKHGVDFGIWEKIKPGQLYCPLDVHSGNVARALGLLSRNANDWKAVEELTVNLRKFDPKDPVKYDFALFGLGVYERFK